VEGNCTAGAHSWSREAVAIMGRGDLTCGAWAPVSRAKTKADKRSSRATEANSSEELTCGSRA
jgi:hypothetical protein